MQSNYSIDDNTISYLYSILGQRPKQSVSDIFFLLYIEVLQFIPNVIHVYQMSIVLS